jgi:hypothetical protein
MNDISRRDFLKIIGAGAFGIMTKPARPLIQTTRFPQASDVVQCYHENATSGGIINESVARVMTDASITTLTGIADVGEAWKSIFPGITENSIIGLKVNCLLQITTHREFTYLLVNSLTQMEFGGEQFKANNIIIWDNQDNLLQNNGGYTIYDGSDPDTVRCFGTNHPGVGYNYSLPFNVNGIASYPSHILTTLCDYIIDAAVIKDHSISQITLTLKNNYGSIHNPGALHAFQCNPYIPSLNQQIRDVPDPPDIQKIFIVDALIGCYSGGPGGPPNFYPNMVLMSFDPVAIDTQGQNLINEERALHGLSQYNAPHITTAAQSPYNLGTTDINLIEIINPGVEEHAVENHANGVLTVTPNPFRDQTTIKLSLKERAGLQLDLVDVSGRVIDRVYAGQRASGTHSIMYTPRSSIPAGQYILRLYMDGTTRTQKLTIMR